MSFVSLIVNLIGLSKWERLREAEQSNVRKKQPLSPCKLNHSLLHVLGGDCFNIQKGPQVFVE